MKNRYITSLFALGLFFLNITMAFAEEAFPDDTQDAPAPINDYIWVAILLGIVVAFFWMKRKKIISAN